jgi:hypothetical protein
MHLYHHFNQGRIKDLVGPRPLSSVPPPPISSPGPSPNGNVCGCKTVTARHVWSRTRKWMSLFSVYIRHFNSCMVAVVYFVIKCSSIKWNGRLSGRASARIKRTTTRNVSLNRINRCQSCNCVEFKR